MYRKHLLPHISADPADNSPAKPRAGYAQNQSKKKPSKKFAVSDLAGIQNLFKTLGRDDA